MKSIGFSLGLVHMELLTFVNYVQAVRYLSSSHSQLPGQCWRTAMPTLSPVVPEQ